MSMSKTSRSSLPCGTGEDDAILCLRGSLEETEVGRGITGETFGPDADLVRGLGLSFSFSASLGGAEGRRRFRDRLRGVVEWRISWRWSG